ncbi:MAG: prolipoprotein diacylglyceryl transferase [Bdellovibrionales bacterium]|nr:prolipoprotein diacylglyceryl transferase [Bdellovibrionales bacterium]
MIPQIFKIGPLPINSFGLMVALAFFAGIYVLGRSFSRNGISADLAEKYVISAAFSGLLGARIWFVLIYHNELNSSLFKALISDAGFVFYGGFLIGLLTLGIMTFIDKISITSFLDSIGPTLALGYAIGRVGCQLSGDGDYGRVTSGVWGMSYSQGVVPTPPGVLVIPTPVYESILSLAIFFILYRVETNRTFKKPLSYFGLYLVLMSVERFLIEFIRIEDRYIYNLSEAQFIAIGLFLAGIALVSRSFTPVKS